MTTGVRLYLFASLAIVIAILAVLPGCAVVAGGLLGAGVKKTVREHDRQMACAQPNPPVGTLCPTK